MSIAVYSGYRNTARYEHPQKSDNRASIGRETRRRANPAAIVTLTHDPKLDEPALEKALGSEAFYIGSLGSRRTHAKRLDRLRALGIGEEDLKRIHGPVGLDIGARAPAEIAVSILAQITQVLRKRGG